jgi:hypothetical protein
VKKNLVVFQLIVLHVQMFPQKEAEWLRHQAGRRRRWAEPSAPEPGRNPADIPALPLVSSSPVLQPGRKRQQRRLPYHNMPGRSSGEYFPANTFRAAEAAGDSKIVTIIRTCLSYSYYKNLKNVVAFELSDVWGLGFNKKKKKKCSRHSNFFQ